MISERIILARPARKKRLISLAPLIDVVFILLVFFMLASSFLDWRVVNLAVPTKMEEKQKPSEIKPVFVSLKADGKLLIDHTLTTRDSLYQDLQSLSEFSKKRPIVLVVEKGINVQKTVSLFEMLSAFGLSELTISKVKE